MLIIHRCTVCGHPDYWSTASRMLISAIAGSTIKGQPLPEAKRRVNCGQEWHTSCDCRACQWGPPETAPRWSNVDDSPVQAIAAPGSQANGGQASSTCSCDDCHALYAALTSEMATSP